MAQEIIVTGRKYRIIVDQYDRIWHRVSFWTKASDVEFDSGRNAEQEIRYWVNMAKSEILRYLTADNGRIFQFAYDWDTGKYGFRVNGEFNPFCACEHKSEED